MVSYFNRHHVDFNDNISVRLGLWWLEPFDRPLHS